MNFTPQSLQKLIPATVATAKEAGRAILDLYKKPGGIPVQIKVDSTPVTQADFLANQIIVTGLTRLTPTIPILSEEGQTIAFEERRGWRHFWLIDPLDGTKEFINGTDEFTVNIALIEAHQPILGVVYVPMLDVCYFACKHHGAFKQIKDTLPQAIHVCKPVSQPIIVAISRRKISQHLHTFLDNMGNHEIIQKGSSLKACLIAEGVADVYPGFGPTSEWDTAASQCIVERAGGKVMDRDLNRLSYNTKETVANPEFLIVGDSHHDWSRYLK